MMATPKKKHQAGKILGKILRWLTSGTYRGTKRVARGTYRSSKRWAKGHRERVRARRENREPTIPSATSKLRTRVAGRIAPAPTCVSCGVTLPRGGAAGHVCGEKQVDQARRASDDYKARQAAKRARRERDGKRPYRDRLKQAADATKTRMSRGTAKCNGCHARVRPEDFATHQCGSQASSPPPTPSPSPSKPALKSVPLSQGSNGRRPPVATSNGTAASSAISTLNEFPKTHEEMEGKMRLAEIEYQALTVELEELAGRLRDKAAVINQFAATMLAVLRKPVCAQPLIGAADAVRLASTNVLVGANNTAEASTKFMETYMAIEKAFEEQLSVLRGGANPEYFSRVG